MAAAEDHASVMGLTETVVDAGGGAGNQCDGYGDGDGGCGGGDDGVDAEGDGKS